MNTKKLWIGIAVVIVVSFGIPGYFGREIYREAPPIPEKVFTTDGMQHLEFAKVLFVPGFV